MSIEKRLLLALIRFCTNKFGSTILAIYGKIAIRQDGWPAFYCQLILQKKIKGML